ncbi:hypothetical protein NPS01_26510 [Nocardioides psychrotolerans]|uniref:Winged helix-turn-helix domain-containing protein n=1 Tax=Nocardioides psychrotolerans TaxID=1005945 RepID=A0A1I3M150_9ACTN|nr:crosslink repair DNA glycosylase YcaQ family protein [Nocardioides psychrotolerans]GEP38988.1 hypothetical protein NPS01_26510 [Nocardioides psychrotolerans]SFI90703.1 hypothetical protein SAMN05216561_114158 [Nocardioides psychrotolerans]
MADVHQLSRTEARRIAIRAQLLDAERPTDVVETVRHLTLVQLDPTNAIAPSADLVLWSRLGSAYDPQDLVDALDEQRLVDFGGAARAARDMRLFRAEMEQWPGAGELKDWQRRLLGWIEANEECRRDILERLRGDGPLPASELPDSCVVPWPSTGWNNNRNVRMMLEQLVQRGEVAVAGRGGRERLWDLAERIYPDDPAVPAEEALQVRDEARLRGLGIARARSAKVPGEPHSVGEAGEAAVVEGVKGQWRVDPALLGQPFVGRTALLSPFDRLVYDRRRMDEVFEFDYVLEMFKPAAHRIWGYYALPVLHDDRLVGKVDARADRDAGVLEVVAIHEDAPFTKAMTAAVAREIRDLADWLGLDRSPAR